jgi:hypothetical protein
MQQLEYNKVNGLFLCGPFRDVISKGQNQLRVQMSTAGKVVRI